MAVTIQEKKELKIPHFVKHLPLEEGTVLYSQNPNLGLKTVETVSGTIEYRDNCQKIKGLFYVRNIECFWVNNTWFRLNPKLITFDYETKKIILVEGANLVQGIVDFDNGKCVFGSFTANPYQNCSVYMGDVYTCINSELLILNNYIEDVSTGVWYHPSVKSVKDLQTPKNTVDNTVKGYNIEDNAEEFVTKTKLYNEFKTELSKDVRRYGRMLGETTFGIEIESARGFLPHHIQNQLGVVICRDGSLNDANGKPGPEYVTIPLKGAKGLQTLSNLGKELSKRNVLDVKCSLHIHLGNLPTTRMYLISLYRLACKIQNEMFQMFPFYKTNPEGIKSKNYNQKLPTLDITTIQKGLSKDEFNKHINDCYNVLFSWLAEGMHPNSEYNRKAKLHPVGQKWNRKSRYYWLNFMNTIFSNRNTVEFRLHGPTTNVQKMVNWLFMCNAIVRYANAHAHKILLTKLPIKLDDVMDYYGTNFGERGKFLSSYLKAYIQRRKDQFYEDYNKGDHLSEWDFKKDKEYQFSYNGVTYLF